MRVTTGVAAIAIVVALGGIAILALSGGAGSGAALTERWTSDTGSPRAINHHAPAVSPQGTVYAPISGERGTDQCALVALAGGNGSGRWRYPVPPANCTIHAVADPAVADYDGDGVAEVFVATTEEALIGLDPSRGAVEFRHELSAYGYTQPVVTDFTGDGTKEVIAVDVRGSVFVLRPDGSPVWTRRSDAYTFGQPRVADFDGDGAPELAVAFGGAGELVVFEADGSVAWNHTRAISGAITWVTTGQADEDRPTEIAVATTEGVVAVLDGRDGRVQWRRDLGGLAAVHAIGDGDGDGEAELYAVAQDGVLRSYAAETGDIEWTTTLTTERVQMTPPPALGDVDGDGQPELVAVTNNGIVALVDPATGDIVASSRREVPIWVHPTIGDATGDGVPEAYVIYGDGRVVAFAAEGG